MARESLASKRERAAAIEERMFEHYGPGKASLDYRTPFELTVAVVLSAQCTDAAVNKVTPRLFAAFPTPAAMAAACSGVTMPISMRSIASPARSKRLTISPMWPFLTPSGLIMV